MSAPPPNRIRIDDVWVDIQDRRHVAENCSTEGLVLMVPLNPVLPPVAMDESNPHPWRRVRWGGEP